MGYIITCFQSLTGCTLKAHDFIQKYPLSLLCVQVSELDFQDSIMVLGFSEELNKELLTVSGS